MRIVLLVLVGLGLLSCADQTSPAATTASATASAAPQTARTASPEGAEIYLISPTDGETVSTTFTVRFGLKGMGVAPAGVDLANTGHHHLLVDAAALPPLDEPMADRALHFGGGQTETTLTLEPGLHTLQLILGDRFHTPHEPPVYSERISITVE